MACRCNCASACRRRNRRARPRSRASYCCRFGRCATSRAVAHELLRSAATGSGAVVPLSWCLPQLLLYAGGLAVGDAFDDAIKLVISERRLAPTTIPSVQQADDELRITGV